MKKRYLFIFIIALFITLYSSCTKSKTEYEKIINQVMDEIVIEKQISANITLPTILNNVSIKWESSNPNIISNMGIVNLPDNDEVVKLRAVFSYKDITKYKSYYVSVLSKKTVLAPIIESKISIFEFPQVIKNNDELPTQLDDVMVKWESNDVQINNNKVVLDDNYNYQNKVMIKGIFTYNGVEIIKEYETTISNSYRNVCDAISTFETGLNLSHQVTGLVDKINDVNITWSYSPEGVVNADGTFNRQEEAQEVSLVVVFKQNKVEISKTYQIVVESFTDEDYVKMAMEKVTLPVETTEDLELIYAIDQVQITWTSKSISYISHTGKINRGVKDRVCKLIATFTLNNCTLTKEYEIKVLKYTDLEFINLVIDSVKIPSQTNVDVALPIYFDYDVIAQWTTNNEKVMDDEGHIFPEDNDVLVNLKAVYRRGDEMVEVDYSITVLGKSTLLNGKPHQVIVRSKDFNLEKGTGVSLDDNRLVLTSTQTEGSYESDIIETMDFNGMVASWASTSSTTCTAELLVKVRVNSTWSEYITYYQWGFGLENKCFDQNNGIIKLTDDEITVLNNKVASAIQFKVILRRNSVMNESPRLSLVSFALKSSSYKYDVDTSSLPLEKVYNVPKLYQSVVPTIGGSICSPTTSTMLLKYKGENFSAYDEYEHRYIAYKFKEYNSGIFGNWVYNTVGISSFGYDAYVARMYSIDELIWHLANVGPVGLSVKGQMTSSEKNYYTNGHLIVGIGYKYINNVLYIVCNDPNVPNVYCEYSVTVMQSTWRNIAYVVE